MSNINNNVKEKLNYLSAFPETDYSFISLYLDVHEHELFEQAEKNRIFLKDAFHKSAEQIKEQGDRDRLNSFKLDEIKIKDFMDNKLDSRTHGLAIFACAKLGIFEAFQTLMPFNNEFTVDSFAHLRQFAYQLSEYEKVLAVMIDARFARILDIRLRGRIIDEHDIENKLHRFHKEGGWAQSRYQRHIENQVEVHYKEVADMVTHLADNEEFKNIILIGQEQEVKNFRLYLPKRINMIIIDTDSLQMRENINEIIKTIIKDLHKKEKEREIITVKGIIDKAFSYGSATLGIQDTIKLAYEGRIQTLAVVKDMIYDGFKCGDCLYITKDQHYPECPKCNGNLKHTDLIENTIRLTFKNRGDVELVEDEAAIDLQKHEGIGAYLRY